LSQGLRIPEVELVQAKPILRVSVLHVGGLGLDVEDGQAVEVVGGSEKFVKLFMLFTKFPLKKFDFFFF
jgi:hypothetical protein